MATEELVHRGVDTPLGPLLLIASRHGLVRVGLPHEDAPTLIAEATHRCGGRVVEAPERLDAAVAQLAEYFAGTRREFTLPVALPGVPPFRSAVLRHLQSIPLGETRTYSEVARALDNPGAVRAVGSACSHNPVPIVIPCHRVLRGDGTIGGYLGGTAAKEWLLGHEQRAARAA
ncbi:MAG TPA: methylated-DNA--[protein]-cysteine S-methyltransferase [Actinomycetaceae bacterium]|nr:methylated-DNA--[protein]-cysteine S-methyltransferase [Actinomycetaceae bacterium]